jgi:hypothetical protein
MLSIGDGHTTFCFSSLGLLYTATSGWIVGLLHRAHRVAAVFSFLFSVLLLSIVELPLLYWLAPAVFFSTIVPHLPFFLVSIVGAPISILLAASIERLQMLTHPPLAERQVALAHALRLASKKRFSRRRISSRTCRKHLQLPRGRGFGRIVKPPMNRFGARKRPGTAAWRDRTQ